MQTFFVELINMKQVSVHEHLSSI